jgi:transcriptional regulator with XRE-family HTH domain
MRRDHLSEIGTRIREARESRGMSLRDLAQGANLSIGLLSKVENFRTIPSLPALSQIALALGVDMGELVQNLQRQENDSYELVRAGEGEIEIRPDSKGLTYTLYTTFGLGNMRVRVMRVVVEPDTFRPATSTDAYEMLHVLSGQVYYILGDDKLHLRTGDFLRFDGRTPHALHNDWESDCVLCKIYFFDE